jgi:hypothetical protein
MGAYDIPAHVQAQLVQMHDQLNASLDDLLGHLAAQGVAGLDAPSRILGIRNALAANPSADPGSILTLAAAAISRLYDTEQPDQPDPAEGIYLP